MRVRKPIEKTCIDCGEVFIAYGNKALRCLECRKVKQLKQVKAYQENKRQQKKPQPKKKYIYRPKLTIREVLRALEKYNKEHKTHISYGQFVALMEKGA